MTWLLTSLVGADEFTHTYEANEAITVWFNRVTAHDSLASTFPFSKLPLCREEISPESTQALTFSEVFQGFEMSNLGLQVRFREESEQKPLCSVQLSTRDLIRLKKVMQNSFWLQLFLDDLPLWQPLGEKTSRQEFINTHFHLEIHYNQNQIVQVFGQPMAPVTLEDSEQSLAFSYSVVWVPSPIPFEARLRVNHEGDFSKRSLYCFLIILHALIAAALLIFIWHIVRGLLYKEYDKVIPELKIAGSMDNYTAAFKQMAGEVFRAPSYLLLFTTCISAGTQLLAVVLSMLLLFIVFPVYAEYGYALPFVLLSYNLCALFGGIRSGSFYIQHRGRNWVWALLLSLLCIPILTSVALLRIPALPLLRSVDGQFFLLVAVPLHIVGTLVGRMYFADPHYPCKVNDMEQPNRYQKLWYEHPALEAFTYFIAQAVLMLFLQFDSLWDFKQFCVYGFGLVAFLLLLLQTAVCSIAVTFWMICQEDYRWPWVSFLGSGSAAGYFYLFALFKYRYFDYHSETTGETYLGYASVVCLGLFLVFGTVGHLAADLFLRVAYSRLKANM